ncbi:MAG: NAD-binding protein, partial [Candidatus Micrarchaeia archaeon]
LLLKLKRYRNHVIIIGLGHMGMIFLNRKISERKDIVVILRDEEKNYAENFLDLRIPVVYGNPSEDIVLEKARITYASEIYILTDDDILNVSVANKVSKAFANGDTSCKSSIFAKDGQSKGEQSTTSKAPKVNCSVHIQDYEFKRSIEKEDWVSKGGENINLMIFNIYEMTARHVVKDIPIEPKGKSVKTLENPWVLIIGFGNMGSALLRQLIRMKVYPGNKKLRITLVDNNAKKHEELLLSKYYDPKDRTRFIFRNVDLYFEQKELEKIHSIHDLLEQQSEKLPHVIYICTENDALTNILIYKIKLSLEEMLKSRDAAKNTKIVAFFRNTIFGSCKEYDSGYTTGNKPIKVYNINIVDIGCSSFMELSEIDIVAKMIHSNFFIKTFWDYLEESGADESLNRIYQSIKDSKNMNFFEKEAEIRKAFPNEVAQLIIIKPSRKEWQFLDEDFKNSNRLQADHLIDKLKVLDIKFNLSTDPKEVKDAINKNEDNVVETLADLEHERYCAEKYVLLDKTDFKRFKDLPDKQKDWNKGIIEDIPAILSFYQKIKWRDVHVRGICIRPRNSRETC